MEEYTKEFVEDIIVITVNLTRLTLNEATVFRKIIDDEIIANHKKLVLDLSYCRFIDSTILGTILVEYKKISKRDGRINIVEPHCLSTDLLSISKTLEKLYMFKSKEDALGEFN